jgi:hypothetical protein
MTTPSHVSYLRAEDPDAGPFLIVQTFSEEQAAPEWTINVGYNEYVGLTVTVDQMSFGAFVGLRPFFFGLVAWEAQTLIEVCTLLQAKFNAEDVTPEGEGWPRPAPNPEPTVTCKTCGTSQIVVPAGRGFPPDTAKKKLARVCAALGHDSDPLYRAGLVLGPRPTGQGG